jgi:predicted metal-binding membrane protein
LAVSALAFAYVYSPTGMEAMPMGVPPGLGAWGAREVAVVFGMWAAMMVGMMLPSVLPMALLYAAAARKAARQGSPLAPTAVFASGYAAIWTLFAAAATAAQWGLERAALLSPMLETTSPALGAAILIAAGAYQLTPLKDACLRQCRSPATFVASHWRAGAWGAFRMGLGHGAFCVGCCAVLMALLFVGGVMNPVWIGAIAGFVLIEKLLPFGAAAGRAAGLAAIAAGALLLARALRG